MFADNFKRPTDLHITDDEFQSLVKVMRMLEREEVPWSKKVSDDALQPDQPKAFQMVLMECETECGSACCIMGWARFLMKDRDLFILRPMSEPLKDLFALGGGGGDGKTHVSWWARAQYGTGNIKPDQAATAIRNYLRTGSPQWDEALALSKA